MEREEHFRLDMEPILAEKLAIMAWAELAQENNEKSLKSHKAMEDNLI
jgi:hypothetical protein